MPDTSPQTSLELKVLSAPTTPGCYLYKDHEGSVIYVGKAVNIKNRVKSYFQSSNRLPSKTNALVANIVDVEFVQTDSELEALLLETNLIKKYRPKYNVLFKDDKNYSWLMLDKGQDFPKLSIVREQKNSKATYFGPFPEGRYMKKVLRDLRKVFNYRTCNRKIVQTPDGVVSSDPKPCLYYHLGLCGAPCAGKVSKKQYHSSVSGIVSIFNAKSVTTLNSLNSKMKALSKNKKFEEAAIIRDKIESLRYISQKSLIKPGSDELIYKKDKSARYLLAEKQLLEMCGVDTSKIMGKARIECYDVSNISGTNAVASMVVFVGGVPDKNLYRKFKIKSKSTPDDFAMMSEVIHRRLRDSDNKPDFASRPDLIIVDGGKGQLSSAYKIMQKLGTTIPVAGLAKQREELFLIDDSSALGAEHLSFSMKVPRTQSEVRFLVQRIRDEAHRFGLGYHRKLRSKSQIKSVLDDIAGIGGVTKHKLYQAFGNIAGIRKASRADIESVIKNTATVNRLIKALEITSD